MLLPRYKVLGQVNPTSGTQTLLYNTPRHTTTKVSSLVVCNYSNSAAKFNVIAANTTGAQFYINSNTLISGNDTMIIKNIGLNDNSNVYVTPVNSSNISFSLFGKEQIKSYEVVTIQYLIVGGGGGGGSAGYGADGGGGAGGLITGTFSVLTNRNTFVSIQVGQGGSVNVNGGNSSISCTLNNFNKIALGGGGGGAGQGYYGTNALDGGSGGGGGGSNGGGIFVGGNATQPGSISGGYGYGGGNGSSIIAGGGGGGAGGAGAAGGMGVGGAGGIGRLVTIPSSTYTKTYAIGGSGGSGVTGTDNTGNGGGGGAAGGSGVVILWWLNNKTNPDSKTNPGPSEITGSYTANLENGYKIYVCTAGNISMTF